MKQIVNIFVGLLLFALAAGAVAAIGHFTIGQKEADESIQGQMEVEEYRVSFKLPGRIHHLYVHEGDYVHVGDRLASLDAPDVQAKKSQATSVEQAAEAMTEMANNGARQEQIQGAYELWQQAIAAKEIAQKSYDRVNRLYEEGVMTAQKRDEALALLKANTAQEQAAKSQYEMAKNGARNEEKKAAAAKQNQARGAVAEVNTYINEMIQTAQFEGEVSAVYPKVGELVGAGSPVMTIAMAGNMWATFNVREDKLKGMKIGTELTAYCPALDKDVKLKIYAIKDQGTYAVWKATKDHGQYDLKTFEVKARPTSSIDGLRAGMSVILK